jgi:hypothetical protein
LVSYPLGPNGIDSSDLSNIHAVLGSLDFSKKCVVALDFDRTLCSKHLCAEYCFANSRENGGALDLSKLMTEVPTDILVDCAPQLMSFYTKPEPSASKVRARRDAFSTPAP